MKNTTAARVMRIDVAKRMTVTHSGPARDSGSQNSLKERKARWQFFYPRGPGKKRGKRREKRKGKKKKKRGRFTLPIYVLIFIAFLLSFPLVIFSSRIHNSLSTEGCFKIRFCGLHVLKKKLALYSTLEALSGQPDGSRPSGLNLYKIWL